MEPVSRDCPRLVADVGGTNTRIALFDPTENTLCHVRGYVNRDYPGLDAVISAWLADLGEPAPPACCLAVAAPLSSDRVSMVNIDWSFSRRQIAAAFGFTRVGWLNDFEANAHSLPHLTQDQRVMLHPGRDGAAGKLATVGPGTGLGGATLQWMGRAPHACPCEPGHMGLSPGTAEEVELFRLLLSQGGEVYAERLVSGPGLQRLYHSLGAVRGERTDAELTPEQISRQGMTGRDPLCTAALATFCALLGSVCGDFLLASGAYGGLYLAGGIAPRLLEFLAASDFHARLVGKGAMAGMLQAVPVYVITADFPGLIGAAHAPLRVAPREA
jgi:glucokinase